MAPDLERLLTELDIDRHGMQESVLCEVLGKVIVVLESGIPMPAPMLVAYVSKGIEWDVEVFRGDDFPVVCTAAQRRFADIEEIGPLLAERLVNLGILGFNELSAIHPRDLARVANISVELATAIIDRVEQEFGY